MAIFNYNNAEIYYEFTGDAKNPCIVFINGLTQRVQHWAVYREYFEKKGYSVLLFDLMGQGSSIKPTLFIDFKDNQNVLAGLLDQLSIDKAYIAGISFGGVVVLRFGIEYPEKVRGLIPMSTFSEMDAQLKFIGNNLYEGMVFIGFEYLVKQFVPLNFSADWIEKSWDNIPVAIRESFNNNDLYGIQNMMESLGRFQGFTHELKQIKAPTLIMNGEYDYLTNRHAHEILRREIPNSRLMLMQHVCHAFTLEIPEITCRIIENFMTTVENGKWNAKQDVMVATDDPSSKELFFACQGDHTRAIPFQKKKTADSEASPGKNAKTGGNKESQTSNTSQTKKTNTKKPEA